MVQLPALSKCQPCHWCCLQAVVQGVPSDPCFPSSAQLLLPGSVDTSTDSRLHSKAKIGIAPLKAAHVFVRNIELRIRSSSASNSGKAAAA